MGTWKPVLELGVHVLTVLGDMGFEGVLVGGMVRDLLAGLPAGDVDIATDAPEEALRELFPSGHLLGPQGMRVFLLPSRGGLCEILSYHGRSLKEDLARRDFTVNAMALRRSGELVASPGAVEDMERRILRFNGPGEERLREDPLRALRLARFASCLPGFTVDPGTLRMCRVARPPVGECPGERLGREVRLGLGGRMDLFLETLAALDLLDILTLFPCDLPPLLDRARRSILVSAPLTVRTALLFCRPCADDEGQSVRKLLSSWGWGNHLSRETADLVRLRTLPLRPVAPEEVASLLLRKGERFLENLFLLSRIVAGESLPAEWGKNRTLFVSMAVRHAREPDVLPRGGDLMTAAALLPGRMVGETLNALRMRNLLDGFASRQEALMHAEHLMKAKEPRQEQ